MISISMPSLVIIRLRAIGGKGERMEPEGDKLGVYLSN